MSNLDCHPVPGGREDQVSCAPIDVSVKISNVSVAAQKTDIDDQLQPQDDPYSDGASPFLPPVYSKPGVLPTTQGCSKMSLRPSFAVSDISWSDSRLTFNLMNTALNYTQKCNINGRPSTLSWLNCTRFDPLHANYPASGIYTSLLYGGQKNILGINQTWYCADEDASKP